MHNDNLTWPSNNQYPEFGRNVCVKASAWHVIGSYRESTSVICTSCNKRKLANKKVNWKDSFSFLAYFKNYVCLFIFATLSLHCCFQAFSSFSKQELLSNCNTQASHCGSLCPAVYHGLQGFRALGLLGSALAPHGLSSWDCGL